MGYLSEISKGRILLLASFIAVAGCQQQEEFKGTRRAAAAPKDLKPSEINYKAYIAQKARFDRLMQDEYAKLNTVSQWSVDPDTVNQDSASPEYYGDQIASLIARSEPVLQRYATYKKTTKSQIPNCEYLVRNITYNPLPSAKEIREIAAPKVLVEINGAFDSAGGLIMQMKDSVDNVYIPDATNSSNIALIDQKIDDIENNLPRWKVQLSPNQKKLGEFAAQLRQTRELIKGNTYVCNQKLPELHLR